MPSFPFRRCLRAFSIAGLLIAVLLLALPVAAQSNQGSIIGTVKDAKGAIVPGATVTLTNVNEGTVRTTTTNASGDYEFLDVVAGTFNIEISAPGFEKWDQNNTPFSTQQVLRADATLAVGHASQTIEVNGNNAGTIETETPQITSALDSREIENLPTNFRASAIGANALSVLQALPSVDFNFRQSTYDVYDFMSIAGTLTMQTIVQVDGISEMSTAANHPQGDLIPSADSIAEVHADGILGDAEHSAPAEVSFTTKGGTNDLHGAAWEYHQDTDLNATPYGAVTNPHIVGNTFGVKLSGPVVIPHLYNGHNKSFFWFLYEGYRLPHESPEEYTVPTQAMLNGDFTNYIVPDESGNNTFQGLTDPATGKVCGYTFAACGFSINSVAQQFLQFYPQPNHTATANLNNGSTISVPTTEYVSGQTQNYYVNSNTSSQSNEIDVRGDQYIGRNQKFLLWGRYTQNDAPTNSPNGILLPSSTNLNNNRGVLISANYAVKQDMINEFRFGYSNEYYGFTSGFDGKAFTDGLGLQGLQNLWFSGMPYLGFTNFTGVKPERFNWGWGNTNWIYNDTFSWVKGRHSMKFGAEFERLTELNPNSVNGGDQYGTFSFGGTSPQFTGVDWSDFLLGIPESSSYDVVPSDGFLVTNDQHYFAQDQWRATPRLTVTYGVRYEFNPGWADTHGLFGNFDTSVAGTGAFIYPTGTQKNLNQPWLEGVNACDPDGMNNTNSATVNGVGCTPVLSNSQAGLPSALHSNTKFRIMPRLGFAYRLTDDSKWVIRAGYGIYNNYISAQSTTNEMTLLLQSGYTTYPNAYQGGSSVTAGTPLYQWPEIYAGAGTAQNTTTPGHANLDYLMKARGWVDPYTEQYTLSLDHDFGKGYGARLSYLGEGSHHLEWRPSLNVFPFSTTTPAYNQPQSARPFPNVGVIALLDPSANANYNALQAEITHRFQDGFSFDSIFTLAKALSDNEGSSPGSDPPEETGDSAATYAFDRQLDYGNMEGVRHIAWKSNVIYALPVGRGRRFGANMPRALDAIIGGWTLSNILDWKSGTYYSVTAGTGGDPSGTGSGNCSFAAGYNSNCYTQHPDRIPGKSLKAAHQSATQWLNPDAFACPGDPNWQPGYGCYTGNAPGTSTTYNGVKYTGKELINNTLYDIPGPIGRFGNAGTGIVVGPSFIQLDSGLSKTFRLSERFRLRAEGTFTNVLNHTNLDGESMNTNVTSLSFGSMTEGLASRNGQVSLRLDF